MAVYLLSACDGRSDTSPITLVNGSYWFYAAYIVGGKLWKHVNFILVDICKFSKKKLFDKVHHLSQYPLHCPWSPFVFVIICGRIWELGLPTDEIRTLN